ncbi:unnamed protein product [Blepharisma stoltei]|uniref:Uncharacterized protein n=1 Tax=Blepharisma stoltei TaxID=1481888 RepID=A0AAU9JNY4_9CILI|nr:unnamed protein product [Blepharisma stoltei]
MAVCVFLLVFLSQTASSSDIVSIFPPYHSQYVDSFINTTAVQLTEAVLGGEEKHTTFGISLWVKIIEPRKSGDIFWLEHGKGDFLQFPCITYVWKSSAAFILYLQLYTLFTEEDQKLSLLITPSDNWIFIAFSASYEKKLLLFYCNNLGTESFNSGVLEEEVILSNAVLLFGIQNFSGRIGDFKVHNNIFNEISDWRLQYSTSCVEVSCTSLFPIIEYGKCDQRCGSQPETFLPIFQPTLYSKTPYMTIDKKSYVYNPWKECNDFSITGWIQVPACQNKSETILEISNNGHIISIAVKLKSSSLLAHCDVLEATIYSFENKTDDSVQLISPNYIGNWFFFAITLNSTTKLFTLYSQNSISAPSASFPLISSSIPYAYSVLPLASFSWIVIGGTRLEIYPGNYADFRFYPGNAIDTTLMQYNSNIFSAATYLDPHCTLWESIWYCKACEIGYFVKNGICNKCHPSCNGCSSDDTEADCLACASGYYAQPGHPSLCFNYCPLGFVKDSYLNQCTGTQGVIANINFDNNLSGDFISSYVYIQFGELSDEYCPKFDYLDPLPANKRGIFIHSTLVKIISQSPTQEDRLFSSDFTIEIWSLVNNHGTLFRANCFSSHKYYGYDLGPLWNLYFDFGSMLYEKISLRILKRDESQETIISPLESSSEWALYSVSLTYDDITKSTKILFVINKNSYTAIVSNHYKELPGMIHSIGNLNGDSFIGFLYSLAMYNYGKTYNEILPSVGTCSSCSACPAVLKSCLPTCNATEYVDENGNCQKCPSECSWICSRAGTCNLCYDDLCYKCTKYEIGTCIQCVENAALSSGQCECQSGYIKQGSRCVEKCSDGFHLDASTQSCIGCLSNCLKCSNGESCTICKTGFVERNGKCECSDGYFLDSSNNCSKCDISCLTCSINSSNCSSCIWNLPILYGNKCYPCDSFESYSTYFIIPISYYTDDLVSQLASNCTEICGDGRNMGQAQCDDGNNKNGDGCSENCTIETGWTCSGGSISSPDICKDITPPLPFLAYLFENGSGYLLALSFSEKVNITSDLSENIKITIDGIKMFSWAISLEKSIYEVALNLYESVESGTGVEINFINPSEIADTSGNQMKEKKVKSILIAPFTYKTAEAMKTSITTVAMVAAAGAAAGSIFTGSFNLQAFWSMLEMMQIQNYLIFLSPQYPNNLITYLRTLSIANGNFLPNPFQLYLVKNDPFPDPSKKFADENFNTDFLMNAGQFVAVWAIILTGLSICIILYKIRPSLSIIRWLKSSFFYAILLRTGIESFLEITLSVLLQLRECSQPNQDIGYLSLILTFLTILYLISTFALIVWQVSLKPKGLLGTKLHERRFGVFYQGFKRDSKLKASFLLFQNIRRVLFLIFCVFLYEHTTVQVLLSASLSLTYTILLIALRPYEQRYLGNFLNIICEILYFAAHCLILKFLDNHISDDSKTNLGWAIIALLSTSLLLHILCLFIVQITNLLQGVKQLKDWFLQNFANKFLKVKRRIIMNEIESSDLNIELSKEETYEEKDSRTHPDGNFLNIDTSGGQLFIG